MPPGEIAFRPESGSFICECPLPAKRAQTAAGADFASPVLARRVQSYISKEGSSGLGRHAMTEQLQADALKAFTSSFDQLLVTLAEKRRQIATVAS